MTQISALFNRRLVNATGPAILALLVLLGGCAVRPIVESPEPEQPEVSRPGSPAPSAAPVQALNRMLEDARTLVAAGDWQGAIVNAERGLRIDRREPELYLLLATSYRGLAQLDRARQFARQGLRYVGDSTGPVALALQEMVTNLQTLQ
ncbi:tetratricopeptide repeat protein [Gilvimarinus sp. F26214L]|uniref:tetratricopeptide repeat protein n=1 Tax=Gilvimarinus sp. DZF01 TaxID=3461371 RepID=UPI004045BFE5